MAAADHLHLRREAAKARAARRAAEEAVEMPWNQSRSHPVVADVQDR